MYLSKVETKNFRNLKDVTISLGEKIVLLGENGVGKSNFIEALRILLDPSYRTGLGENDFTRNGQLPFRGRCIEIHAWFSGIDAEKDKDLLAVIHDCHGKEENTYRISAVYRPKAGKSDKDATSEDDYELIRFGGGNETNTDGAKRFRQYVRLVTIPAIRDMERDMQSWRTSPLRRLVEMLDLTKEQDFQKVADAVAKASKDLQQIPPIQELQKEVRQVLGNLVEGQSLQPTIEIAGANAEDLLRLLTILTETDLPIERSSLGVSNILYLITWLIYSRRLRQIPLTGDQKPEYVLLAIEEPEAHLHPHWQRLAFENVFKQEHLLLVSTHSPTIVSVADPRHFVVLKRSDSGIQAYSTACFASSRVNDEKEKLLRDVSRFLDATRGEVVFSRGVLLVEGDAEMFLIPAFAQKMKEAGRIAYTLDGAGISVCNVYGTEFRPYVEFLGPSGLNVPIAVLTDGDPKDKTGEDDDVEIDQPGLKRGLELARRLNAQKLSDIEKAYEGSKWDDVRTLLQDTGIFVNESTLEIELTKAGYEEEFCEVYSELGATEKQRESFRKLIEAQAFEKVIKRIESVGKGKGRFAQRLADKLDADRVPPYIEKAIHYLLGKIPQPIPVQTPMVEETPASSENAQDASAF